MEHPGRMAAGSSGLLLPPPEMRGRRSSSGMLMVSADRRWRREAQLETGWMVSAR